MAFTSVPNLNTIQVLETKVFFMSIHAPTWMKVGLLGGVRVPIYIIFLKKNLKLNFETYFENKSISWNIHRNAYPSPEKSRAVAYKWWFYIQQMVVVTLSPIYNFVNEILVHLEQFAFRSNFQTLKSLYKMLRTCLVYCKTRNFCLSPINHM